MGAPQRLAGPSSRTVKLPARDEPGAGCTLLTWACNTKMQSGHGKKATSSAPSAAYAKGARCHSARANTISGALVHLGCLRPI